MPDYTDKVNEKRYGSVSEYGSISVSEKRHNFFGAKL